MARERTLGIIKPDAVERGLTGPIIATIEEAGFSIVALKKVRLTESQARTFYAVHRGMPFYEKLTSYMSSGPSVAMVIEKDGNAIEAFRALMGVTDPAEAAPGTIRARWGKSTKRNAIHGSDCSDSATSEVAFFFSEFEITGGQR